MSPEHKIEFNSIFNKLSQVQRDHLMVNFDRGESCILEYEPGKFLGCHVATDNSYYTIIGASEFWCYGQLNVPKMEVVADA